MDWLQTKYVRFYMFFLVLLIILLTLLQTPVQARDYPDPLFQAQSEVSASAATSKFTTADGFTHWRDTVNTGCSFSDHNFNLEIDADPADMSEISYTMTNFDVDFIDPQGACPGGPEVDLLSFNGNSLGVLAGANNAWSVNTYALTQAQIIQGANAVYINTDASGTGCWCVGVGYIEVRAKVGFKVTEKTPKANDKNRAFEAANLDLSVKFSDDYDTATLTSSSFLLEYRDSGGSWQQTAGSFTQLGPKQFHFTPNADLKDGVRYRVTIKSGASGVLSKAGAALTADDQWYFWTVPNLDVNDSFGGAACPPETSPCDGVEIAVFQVARNKQLVKGKEGVARVYMRWKERTDVLAADQVTELNAEIKITGGGISKKVTDTLKRPDKITAADRKAAKNSINIYHTPSSGADYAVEITPKPQTNATPVVYTGSKAVGNITETPSIAYDYYFLKDGSWSAGVPAAAKVGGRALMTTGNQAITDMFPVLGTSFIEKTEFSIGYTNTGTKVAAGACGMVDEVNCPGSSKKAELYCVYNKLTTMRGGNKFVAATVPATLCPPATAFALGGKVFMHQHGNGANSETIAHEVGHVFAISTANNPTPKHRNNSSGVEGFQVRSKTNRSFTDDPATAVSLMATDLQTTGTQWIHNDDYDTLLGSAASISSLVEASHTFSTANSAAVHFLIVSGEVDFASSTIAFAPAFLQERPNDPPTTSGQCHVQLLDGGSVVLAEDFVDPGLDAIIELPGGGGGSDPNAPDFFSVSLPWDPAATSISMDCGGGVSGNLSSTLNRPIVSITEPMPGAVLSGIGNIAWSGSDPDGDALNYQLQLSLDGGLSWLPQMPLSDQTALALDTTLLASGSVQLRIMVTDGFHTAYDTIDLSINNGLSLQGVLPVDGSTEVQPGSPVSAIFLSDVDPASLTVSTFKLLSGSTEVVADVRYNSRFRTAILTPVTELQADTVYTAQLTTQIKDAAGRPFAGFSWSFTTAADTSPPSVVTSSPTNGDTHVPLNGLIQIVFDEELDATSVNTSNIMLLDPSMVPVAASIQYVSAENRVLLLPEVELLPFTIYTIVITEEVVDSVGLTLNGSFQASFETGEQTSNGLRIVGNYEDVATDADADGLFETLTIFVEVEVLASANYNLNGRLQDSDGRLIQWTSTGNLFLTAGVHRLNLQYDSVPITNNGLHGPYTLDSLNFYLSSNPAIADVGFKVFDSFPYDLSDFFSIMRLGPLNDLLLAVDSRLENAFNLRDLTFHVSEPVSSISYRLLVNSNPDVQIIINADASVDVIPAAATEAESDITIEATDLLGNKVQSRFHVSVQAAKPSNFLPDFNPQMFTDDEQTISIQLLDQFGNVFMPTTGVMFSTTLGEIQPGLVSTINGEASATLRSGTETGMAFVTVNADQATTVLPIEIARQVPTCMVNGSSTLRIKPNKVEWLLTNQGDETITLEALSLTWPNSNGAIKKIKLGEVIYKNTLAPPSSVIDSNWIGDLANRQIASGESKKMVLQFRNRSNQTTVLDYQLEAQFSEGCEAKFVPASPDIISSNKLHVDGKKLTWELTNIGKSTATIKSIELMWPAVNGSMRSVALEGKFYDTVHMPATAVINDNWKGHLKHRQLRPGKSSDLTFRFANYADASLPLNYGIVVQFIEGGAIQFPSPSE